MEMVAKGSNNGVQTDTCNNMANKKQPETIETLVDVAEPCVMRRIQLEIEPWTAHNFPGYRDPTHPACGIVEEMGELAESRTREQRIDAAGDACIYALDCCSQLGVDATVPWDMSRRTSYRPQGIFLGRLCRSVLKLRQGIRTTEDHRGVFIKAAAELFANLEHRLAAQGDFDETIQDLEDVVQHVWRTVQKRDWRADPSKGARS